MEALAAVLVRRPDYCPDCFPDRCHCRYRCQPAVRRPGRRLHRWLAVRRWHLRPGERSAWRGLLCRTGRRHLLCRNWLGWCCCRNRRRRCSLQLDPCRRSPESLMDTLLFPPGKTAWSAACRVSQAGFRGLSFPGRSASGRLHPDIWWRRLDRRKER